MGHEFEAYLIAHRQEVLDLLKELVEINSFTRNPEGVNRVGVVMSGFLSRLGFQEEVHERRGIGHHQVFTRGGEGKRLLFLTHKDTVFPEDSGFDELHVEGDRVTGPGVIDMKGGIVVLLYALKMLQDMGIAFRSHCTITAASDEEAGSEDSRAVTEAAAEGKDYCLVFECGGEKGELCTSRKGVGTFFIDIQGKAAHAGHSYTLGVDANLELAKKLIETQALTDLEKGTTVNVGEISGGIGANTISPPARMTIDLRFEEPEEGERVHRRLGEIAAKSHVPGTASRLSGIIQRPVMVETRATRDFLGLVSRAVGEPIPSEHRGGVSDANFTAALGVPTLDGFGPSGGDDHKPTEHMTVDTLFQRISLLARLLVHISES